MSDVVVKTTLTVRCDGCDKELEARLQYATGGGPGTVTTLRVEVCSTCRNEAVQDGRASGFAEARGDLP